MSLGFVGRFFSGIKGYYNEINGATLTGAIDVIIIEQADGSYVSSPFHVRFGKMGVLRSRAKVVDVEINGEVADLQMKLGEAGEAFFVEEVGESTEEIPEYLATSPIPSSMDLMMSGMRNLELEAQQSDEAKIAEWQEKSLHGSIPENPDDENPLVHTISLKDLKSDSSHDESSRSGKQRRKVYTKKKQKSVKVSPRPHIPGSDQEGVFEMDSSESSENEELKNLSALPKSVSMPLPDPNMEEMPHMKSWRKSSTIEAFMHPLSEPELDPMDSQAVSRPPSPKSDTEVDIRRVEDSQRSLLMEDSATWEWGAFPTTPTSELPPPEQCVEEKEQEGTKQNSGGIFKLWKKSPDKDVKKETKEIYLDDLALEDPEMAKIYLGTPKGFQSIKEKEDDAESGRGPSLPQSPHSVEGAIGGPSVSFLQSEVRHLGRVSLSLCGGLSDPEGVSLDKFMQKVVTFDDLCENPNMTMNSDLVIKIDDGFYNWPTASPMVLSQIVFRQDLPETASQSLIKEHMPKKEKKKGYSWFSWRRGDSAVPPISSTAELHVDTSSNKSNLSDVGSPPTSPPPSLTSTPRKMNKKRSEGLEEHTSSEAETDHSERDNVKSSSVGPSSPRSVGPSSPKSRSLEPGSPRSGSISPSPRSIKSDSQSGKSDSVKSEVMINMEGKSDREGDNGQDQAKSDEEESVKFKKSLRLSSEQIAKLNLKEGQNEISFSVTTQYQGTSRCTSHIYLWKYSDRIVVSDIDGTITKSDVLGQILPILGRDWSQSGVASLFTRIHRNGYKLIYLSARAIGQSRVTKELLRNIKQGELVLPEGPLLLNPTSLISAFHREVVIRKPEEFKISCLKDIQALFPTSPFYAGFGNKINDVWAYRALSIPNFRIFTINHRGELRHELSHTFQSSYTKMSDVVDYFFPPVEKSQPAGGEFNSVSYWREPLPTIQPELELLNASKAGKGDNQKGKETKR